MYLNVVDFTIIQCFVKLHGSYIKELAVKDIREV